MGAGAAFVGGAIVGGVVGAALAHSHSHSSFFSSHSHSGIFDHSYSSHGFSIGSCGSWFEFINL